MRSIFRNLNFTCQYIHVYFIHCLEYIRILLPYCPPDVNVYCTKYLIIIFSYIFSYQILKAMLFFNQPPPVSLCNIRLFYAMGQRKTFFVLTYVYIYMYRIFMFFYIFKDYDIIFFSEKANFPYGIFSTNLAIIV